MCSLAQDTPAPVPRIVAEDAEAPPPADPAPAPKPKIVELSPSEPVPVLPELLPDPLPSLGETPPKVSKASSPTANSPKVEPPGEAEPAAIKVKAVKTPDSLNIPAPPQVKDPKPGIPISARNNKDARTLFLSIPAPRGQIVDRHGSPLAQNKMGHFLGLQFQLKADIPNYEVLGYARPLVAYIQKHAPDGWDVKDETLLEHYKNRRWLPLLASRPIPAEATPTMIKALPKGVVAVPCYLRTYPEGKLASHLLGEMGRSGGMTTNPIQNGDTIWPPTEGKGGLEQKFNAILAGTPGKLNIVFNAAGEKISEEIIEAPIPGQTLVTSLDLFMQQTAERTLRDYTKRGAFVIMDVPTGDVLAMASNPCYDPNLFAFGVREADYKKLLEDKNKPLFCRAKNGTYPPASTFKVITALAALEAGKVEGETYYDCTTSLFVGDKYFHNWNRKSGEGRMNVVQAIKRSCNTWFYQAALATGATPIGTMATRFGLGEHTGLCIADSAGIFPTSEWWLKRFNTKMSSGDLMNICIGQGFTLVTPLQDCAMMAGVARGHSVPRARLVQQVQNLDGDVTEFYPPQNKSELDLQPGNLKLVQAGMKAVVQESGGTGKEAANSYVSVAGKTGTAQWGPIIRGEQTYMAWFSGYMPADNPQYAFAAVYEGDPGQDQISGGRKVAPLIGSAFNAIYKWKKSHGDDLGGPKLATADSVRRAKIAEDGETGEDIPVSTRPRRARPAEEPTPLPPGEAPRSGGGLRWLWNKVRGR